MAADLHAIDAEPGDDSIFPLLTRVLEMADAGEISSLGVCIVHRDGSTQQLWSCPPNVATLLGSVHRLAHKLNLELDD